jgi:hypothetical protein
MRRLYSGCLRIFIARLCPTNPAPTMTAFWGVLRCGTTKCRSAPRNVGSRPSATSQKMKIVVAPISSNAPIERVWPRQSSTKLTSVNAWKKSRTSSRVETAIC